MPDRRARRHAATRDEILAAAWTLARDRGLEGWSLRDLAAAVGMRAPSLYGYFEGKDAIYDAMYAQGYEQLLARAAERLRQVAHAFFDFAVADPARHQLLFQRVIPGFAPSASAYALAEQALEVVRERLAAAGIVRPEALDLWTALLTGLTSQQVSNDPGGDRWARLVDEAIGMYLAAQLPAATRPGG